MIEMNISGTHASLMAGTLESRGTLEFLKLEMYLLRLLTWTDCSGRFFVPGVSVQLLH